MYPPGSALSSCSGSGLPARSSPSTSGGASVAKACPAASGGTRVSQMAANELHPNVTLPGGSTGSKKEHKLQWPPAAHCRRLSVSVEPINDYQRLAGAAEILIIVAASTALIRRAGHEANIRFEYSNLALPPAAQCQPHEGAAQARSPRRRRHWHPQNSASGIVAGEASEPPAGPTPSSASTCRAG
jgi:hypothetical protein